jgi:hypothetical protein
MQLSKLSKILKDFLAPNSDNVSSRFLSKVSKLFDRLFGCPLLLTFMCKQTIFLAADSTVIFLVILALLQPAPPLGVSTIVADDHDRAPLLAPDIVTEVVTASEASALEQEARAGASVGFASPVVRDLGEDGSCFCPF